MFLSQQEILQLANDPEFIKPFEPSNVKPASYTFRVGEHYLNDQAQPVPFENGSITLQPGDFINIESLEDIKFPDNIGGILSTRGSIAKRGIDALLNATIIEPGSTGKTIFHLKNHSTSPQILKTGDLLVKCLFFKIL